MMLEKMKIHKMRWLRILPIIMLANIVDWIDKSMINFALSAGMSKELAMSSSVAGLMGTVFTIGYIILQVPGGALAAKGRSKKIIAFTMVGWIITVFLTGAATSANEVLIYRFLLGFSQGAIYPALVTYVSNWFPDEERGRATAFLVSSAAIAQIVVGPTVSFVLINNSWRTLFYCAAIITAVFLVIWMLFFEEHPKYDKFISKEEKQYILERLEIENISRKPIEKVSVLEIIRDKNIWKLCLILFCWSFGYYGLNFWLPTMIKNITNMKMSQIGIITVIPNVIMLMGVLTVGVVSDKTEKRRSLIAYTPVIFTGILVLAMIFKKNVVISFSMICISSFFIQAILPNVWAILPRILPLEKCGSARGILNIFANIGGVVGPLAIGFLSDTTGSMVMTWTFVFALTILGLFVSLSLPKSLDSPGEVSEQELKISN